MALPNSISVTEPLCETGCTLGEGPLYDFATAILHFVDIVEKRVLHYNTITGNLSVDQYNEPISCLALRDNGRGLACAAGAGFALLDSDPPKLNYLSTPISKEDSLHIRFNDGACDSQGRFFAGTICSEKIPGRLYRLSSTGGEAELVDSGFTDCNGCGWSEDETMFYLTDSLRNLIYAYDYNNGELSNRRVHIDSLALGLPKGTFPDGLCFDSDGCIWSARWGGSKIVRHAKDGSIDFEVHFPTALNITACCFGGPNNDQLFVTTAHCGAIGGDASRQGQYSDSGHIFQVDLSGRYKGGKWRYNFAG